jgi:nucleoid DNA-binding protein
MVALSWHRTTGRALRKGHKFWLVRNRAGKLVPDRVALIAGVQRTEDSVKFRVKRNAWQVGAQSSRLLAGRKQSSRDARQMSEIKTPTRKPAQSTVAATMSAALKAARTRSSAVPTPVEPAMAPDRSPSSAKKAGAAKKSAAARKPVVKKSVTKAAKPVSKPASVKTLANDPASGAGKVAVPRAAAVKGDAVKLRMLVDQVVKATGAKKKGVKELVEATLARIGEALARGDELNLPGFGKLRVVKSDDKDGTTIMTLKLRQTTARANGGTAKETLADEGDDD